jgi:hypothetical protein
LRDVVVAPEPYQKRPWWEDSSTYWAIFNRGRLQGVRHTVVGLGEQRFGTPSPEVVAYLESVADLERLEGMLLRILSATGWNDLINSPELPPPDHSA